MIHDLKCWPEYFQAVKSGIKPFELRKDDRGFSVGDVLHLREFDPDTALYTGDEIDKTVTYVLPTKLFGAIGEGAKYVIMGLAPRDWTPCAEGLPSIEDLKKAGKLKCYQNSERFNCSCRNGEVVTLEWQEVPVRGKLAKRWRSISGSGWIVDPEFVLAWQPLPEPWTGEKKGESDAGN